MGTYLPPGNALPPPPRPPFPPKENATPDVWEAFAFRQKAYEKSAARWRRECRRRTGKATIEDTLEEMLEMCDEALEFDPLNKPHQRLPLPEPEAPWCSLYLSGGGVPVLQSGFSYAPMIQQPGSGTRC